MNSEIQIDDKGRITIPADIRNKFKLKSGERVQLLVQENGILIKPKISTSELLKIVKKFQTEVLLNTKVPFPTKTLFEE